MGDDNTIVSAARVSLLGESKGAEQDKKLIAYLLKNKHTSPFEQVEFQFRVKCPLFVARQWHRHRTWCLSGESEITFDRPNRLRGGTHCKQSPYSVEGFKLKNLYQKFINPRYTKRIKNMLIRVYNEKSGTFENSHITNIFYSGNKEVYRLVLENNNFVEATKDHLFLTRSGWKKLEQLGSNDFIISPSRKRVKRAYENVLLDEQAERWTEIKGFSGYEVSNFGRIRRWKNTKGSQVGVTTLKKIALSKANRAVVSLSLHGKSRAYQVSRLVYSAFVEDVTNKFVLHKDDNPLNNRIENLYIGTPKDNADDIRSNGNSQVLCPSFVKVKGIFYIGKQDTYDIEVSGNNHNFLANNIVTHNSYNEISRRYTAEEIDFYIPAYFRKQAESNRQASTDEKIFTIEWQNYTSNAENLLKYVTNSAENLYKTLLDNGVAREQARMVLPQNMNTMFYAKTDLHNLLHFIDLRDSEHSQYEIRVYAQAMLKLITPIVPWTIEAWSKLKGEQNV